MQKKNCFFQYNVICNGKEVQKKIDSNCFCGELLCNYFINDTEIAEWSTLNFRRQWVAMNNGVRDDRSNK